jgi:MtfA peptidase
VTGIGEHWRRWVPAREAIPERLWRNALDSCHTAAHLGRSDRVRLRETAARFLHEKSISTAHDFALTDAMTVHVAVHACVPILNLGLASYSGWKGIIIYPGDFRARRHFEDDSGVVHEGHEDLCGESLAGGPMVLSWDAIEGEAEFPDQDLVIHECAHKIDVLNGDADGCPPLHPDMNAADWTRVMRRAYDTLNRAVDREEETLLDPYAATDAAEFFAVTSETFFAAPDILQEEFPDVYTQLRAFYRQDPLTESPDP